MSSKEKIIYYIYEIPGKKVGCTKNLETRMQQQKAQDNHRVIITTPDKVCAGILERYWQEKLGYKVDRHLYSVSAKAGEANTGIARSEKTKKKISDAKKGNKSKYGLGNLYRELSTGFEGYASDHVKHFGIQATYLHYSKMNVTLSKGERKGMCWVIV